MIYVANLSNLFWTNGSLKKPSTYPPNSLFTPLPNHFITWTEQQITGWIQLEGEYNYLSYNGTFYFLHKSEVSHESTAWIYAVTKDFWCTLLKQTCSVKGTLNATNDEPIILENLDYVKPLLEQPAHLYRVNFEPDPEDWKTEIQILRWSNPDEITQYIGQDDWANFYSQVRHAKKPENSEAFYPIIIGQLKATAHSTYKKRVLSKLNELLADLDNYFPGHVTTLGTQTAVHGSYCITTDGGRVGVSSGGLSKHKEYVKIHFLDFSGLSEIRPIKIIDLDLKLSSKPYTEHTLTEKPLAKFYRELAPKTYLPYFNNWVSAFQIPPYKGRFSQVVFSKSSQGTKALLDYLPDLNFKITSRGFQHTLSKGRLGFQLFEPLTTSVLTSPTLLTSLDFLTGLTEGWTESVTTAPGVIPLEIRDKAKRLYASIWPNAYKSYLDLNHESDTLTPSLPQILTEKFLTTNIRLQTPIEPTDYFFTSQQFTWIEDDEADTTKTFLNIGKIPPTTNRDESYPTGVVAMFDPKTKKFGFYNIIKQEIPLTLSTEPENDVLGVTYPKSSSFDPDTSTQIDYKAGRTFYNTLYIVKRLFNSSSRNLQKTQWLSEIAKYPVLIERAKSLIRVPYEWFIEAGGFANNGSVKNSILGKDWSYLEPDSLDDLNFLWNLVTDVKPNGEYRRLCNDTKGLINWPFSSLYHTANKGALYAAHVNPAITLGFYLSSKISPPNSSCGFKFNKTKKLLVIFPYWENYATWSAQLQKALLDIKNVSAVGEDWETPFDMSTAIDGLSWPAAILEALGKGHFSKEQFIAYEEDKSGFEKGELEFYDLIGTNYILLIDRGEIPHLIFKTPVGIEERTDKVYKLAHHEIPQTVVDIISQKNVLSVYNQQFEIKDRFIWSNLAWRGKVPSLSLRRFKPSNKFSPFEEMIISYSDPKTVIDGTLRIAKEELNWTNVDPIQAERLKLEISKWKDEYDERKQVAQKEIERQYLSFGEKWISVGLGALSPLNSLTSLPHPQPLENTQRLANSILSGVKLKRDIDVETRRLSYNTFLLDYEHHFKIQEYKLALFQSASTQNLAPINDRTVINEYCDYFDVDQVYIRHFTPSEVQRKLAEEMFALYGAECLIPEIELTLKNGMKPGFYRYAQLQEYKNLYELRDREFIEGIMLNGVRILGEVKEEDIPQVQPLSWQQQYANLMQDSTLDQWEIVLKTAIAKLPEEKCMEVLQAKFNNETEIINTLLSSGKDKKKLLESLQTNVDDSLLYSSLETANKIRSILRKALSEYLPWTVSELFSIPNIEDLLVSRSNGKLVKKSTMEIANRQIERIWTDKMNDLYNVPAKLFDLFYRPILEKIKRVYVKTSNNRFGETYGSKDVVILEYANTNKIFEPLQGKPGYAYCSWGLHLPIANAEWQLTKYTYPYNKLTFYPDQDFETIKTKMTSVDEYDFVTDPTKALVLVDEPKNMVVMFNGRVVDLSRPNKTLHWDRARNDFVWRDVDHDSGYIPIQYIQDLQRLLSLEIFGVRNKKI